MMLEATACGTPPVAFGVGGIPDTITDGVNGRMILGFDTAAMAWAVTELLFAPARAAAMARAARETIEEVTRSTFRLPVTRRCCGPWAPKRLRARLETRNRSG